MTTKDLRDKLLKHKDIVAEAILADAYRFHRYDIPFSLAIFYSDHHRALENLHEFIRHSDKVVPIEKHFVCIIFGCVGHEAAYKASENILYKINNKFPDVKASAGLTSVNHTDDIKDLIFRAMSNLQYAMREQASAVEDDSVIDYLVLHDFSPVDHSTDD